MHQKNLHSWNRKNSLFNYRKNLNNIEQGTRNTEELSGIPINIQNSLFLVQNSYG